VLATAHLGDDEFLEAFHSCRLRISEFRHADHLRLAWLRLAREPFETALVSVRSGIRAFAKHYNLTGLYHETITTAWVHLLATHRESTFEEFLTANEPRLNSTLLHHFWTPEVLASREARRHWVPPDLRDLPQLAR
jgi:CDP-diacylglycerol--glycerol-3-phosphate 3-phosphatidyltransferase